MKKYKGFRREWAKIRSASHYSEIRYAMMGLNRRPIFGMYTVLPIPDKWLMEVAKDDAMRRQIKPLRAKLQHIAGVTLAEPEWIVYVPKADDATADSFWQTTIGWKAETIQPIGREAMRRMLLAERRARRVR